MSLLRWTAEPPPLRRPLLVCALEGFVDAGAVASTAGMFLRHRWQSELVATFDGDALIDYRARRPTAVLDAGVLRRVEWPDLELFAATVEGEQDALLLLGPEPDMAWRAFCEELVTVCRDLEVAGVVGLGAYPAAAPHTRPVRIMRASNTAAGELAHRTPGIPGYTGPVGIGSAVQSILAEHGIPAVGLWAEVPHYIAGSPNPQGALALVRVLADLFGVGVDTTELEAAAKLHREQVDEAVAEHTDAGEMIAALERHADSGDDVELPTGDDIAAEIERFLRTQPE